MIGPLRHRINAPPGMFLRVKIKSITIDITFEKKYYYRTKDR